MYWYKHKHEKNTRFVDDSVVGDNPHDYFSSEYIEQWGHKDDYNTIDICFPEMWREDDDWEDEDDE